MISFSVLRKLQEFESPFITYKYINSTDMRIVLRKNYWDTTYDVELLNDPITLNLLYIQVSAEIRSNWISVTKEVQHELENLEKSGSRKEVCLLRQANNIQNNLFCVFIVSVPKFSSALEVLWLRTICTVLLRLSRM